jgi:hypothetical protein
MARGRTNFFRRTRRENDFAIDRRAVAIAHHRYYCRRRDRNTCADVEQEDIDYAEELAEVLNFLPPWTVGS